MHFPLTTQSSTTRAHATPIPYSPFPIHPHQTYPNTQYFHQGFKSAGGGSVPEGVLPLYGGNDPEEDDREKAECVAQVQAEAAEDDLLEAKEALSKGRGRGLCVGECGF